MKAVKAKCKIRKIKRTKSVYFIQNRLFTEKFSRQSTIHPGIFRERAQRTVKFTIKSSLVFIGLNQEPWLLSNRSRDAIVFIRGEKLGAFHLEKNPGNFGVNLREFLYGKKLFHFAANFACVEVRVA